MLSLKRAQGRSEGARGFKGPGIEPGLPWRSAPTLIRRSLVIRPRSATSLDLVFSALLRLLRDFFRPKPSKNHPLWTCTGGIFQPPGIFQITLSESCRGEKKKSYMKEQKIVSGRVLAMEHCSKKWHFHYPREEQGKHRIQVRKGRNVFRASEQKCALLWSLVD